MNLKTIPVARFAGVLAALVFAQAGLAADPDDRPASTGTNAVYGSDPRYGLFDALDHRSAYTQEAFSEPFLVEDMALEDNELELTWLHTKAHDQESDAAAVEFQKGIGLLTLEAEVPYEWNKSPEGTARGVGDVQLGARYPLYQFVSDSGLVDTTFGVAMEGGIPVQSRINDSAEIEPEFFNCLKLGSHLTLQSVLGYSTLIGGGDDDDSQTIEYGFSLAYTIPRNEFALPGVQAFIPIAELDGERGLNKDEAGQDDILADVGFRLRLNPIGEVQPGFGFAYVFPVDTMATREVRWGCIVSLIFEF